MERRDFFSLMAAGGGVLGASALAVPEARANWGMVAPGPVPGHDFDGRLLVNKARAYEIMDREGLDGIVALNPVNIFYLGNYFSYELQKLRAIPSFAVMPRDEKQPTFLVAAGTDLMFLANGDREYPEIVPYSFPLNIEKYIARGDWSQEPDAAAVGTWPTTGGELRPKEQNWINFGNKVNERRAATPEWALVRALELAGLGKGKIAVDDMRIAVILKTLDRNKITCVPGDNTFRKIRMIKSEVELKHMRTVARINQDACIAMLRQLHKGSTKDQVDQIFMVEAAKRGAKAMWIASGTIGGFTEGKLIPGEPMMVDAVCQRNFYHGDFGRTFVLGEPSKELKACMAAIKVGWETALANVKPGMKYSQISKMCSAAMQQAYTGSSTIKFMASPHSVGLQHTDQPYRDGVPFMVGDDLTFEENMTLTVDLPTFVLGWGWLHCEDLIVVTKTGCAPLATADGPLVVI